MNEYLSLVMKLIFAFGLSFQLPVVLSLLARVGFVDSEFLKTRRKYVVIIIFTAAAILTPPDPITQIGLAIPLLILYELSIFSVKFIENKSDIEILAIGIGHDVSRYYKKAIKISDVQELGDVMIEQLSGLFEHKKKFH